MSTYFVIGDVHGKISMLDQLLEHWDGQSQLVFLGDLIDRGENSRAVLERVKSLCDQQKAICLAGNHEYMFLTWLDNPRKSYEHYRGNGGNTTINSILGRPLNAPVDGIKDAERVQQEAADLVTFIRNLPFVFETEHYIFVHAGLDLNLADWRQTSDYQKVWIRESFHHGHNHTGKTIVFGHTPTFYLFSQAPGTKRLWMTGDGKIGMDGGAVYGGVLHGVLFGDSGILKHYFVEANDFATQN